MDTAADSKGSPWTPAQEQLLVQWSERMQYYAGLHQHCTQYYMKYNRWIGLPIKIVLALSAGVEVLQLGLSGTNNNSNQVWGSIVVLVMCIIGGIASVVESFLNYTSLISSHDGAMKGFDSLIMDIQDELATSVSHRQNATLFVDTIKRTMTKLKESSPPIPESVLDQYVAKIEKLHQTPNRAADVVCPPVPSLMPMTIIVDHSNVQSRDMTISPKHTSVVNSPNISPATSPQDAFEHQMEMRIRQARRKAFEDQLNRLGQPK